MKFDSNNIPDEIKLTHAINYKKIKSKAKDYNLEYENIFPAIQKIGWRMVKTCIDDGGVGLAGPQIGIEKKIIVVREFENEGDWESTTDIFKLYINPTVTAIKETEQWVFEETCLSVSGKSYKLWRHDEIFFDYWHFNEENELVEVKEEIVGGYLARVLLHEYDHLLGISIVDRYKQQKKKKHKQ